MFLIVKRCDATSHGQIRGGFDLTSGSSAVFHSLLYILGRIEKHIACIFGSGDGEVTKVTVEDTPGLGVETRSLLSGAGLPPLLDQPM